MENKRYVTVKEQILNIMNTERLKQEVQLNEPFKLDVSLKISIEDLLEYGADVAVPGDFSLSYHNSVMKLKDQINRHVVPASQYSFQSLKNRELQINWFGKTAFIITDYQSCLDEFLRFSHCLDDLKIPGITLNMEGTAFLVSHEEDFMEFRMLNSNDYEQEVPEINRDYNHLYENFRDYVLKHSLDGKEPIKMTLEERWDYEMELTTEFYRLDYLLT